MPDSNFSTLASGTWNNVPWIITDHDELILNPNQQPVTYIHKPEDDGSFWLPWNSIIHSVRIEKNIDTTDMQSCRKLFSQLYYLKSADLRYFDTTNVSDTRFLFCECYILKHIFLPQIPGCMNNITNAGSMFMGCFLLSEIDLSNFTPQHLISIASMFCYCTRLSSINLSNIKFNKSSKNYLFDLFDHCESLHSIQLFSGSVCSNDFKYMFHSCTSLSSINLSSITPITNNPLICSNMFRDCRNLQHIQFFNQEKHNTNHVTRITAIANAENMFSNCTSLESVKCPNPILLFSKTSSMYYKCDHLQHPCFQLVSTKKNFSILQTYAPDSLIQWFIDAHQLVPDDDLFIAFAKYDKSHLLPKLLNEQIYPEPSPYDPLTCSEHLNRSAHCLLTWLKDHIQNIEAEKLTFMYNFLYQNFNF